MGLVISHLDYANAVWLDYQRLTYINYNMCRIWQLNYYSIRINRIV